MEASPSACQETSMPQLRPIPSTLRLGVATAAYQIEGAVSAGGRVPSIWDTFSHTPGKVANGDTGDVACDSYHRWEEDLGLIKGLGLDAYRLSIAWPRIIGGLGHAPTQEGLDYYKRLLDALRDLDIAPVVTLYHWDLPQWLQDQGGWANRFTALQFGAYAEVLARELGDRVETWTTLNEPWVAAFLGHASGVHAPGSTDGATALAAAHHLNLAHGSAATAIRSVLPEAKISVTHNLQVIRPALASDPAHQAAAQRIRNLANEIFLGPQFAGAYPEDLIDQTVGVTDWGFVHDGDLVLARQPLASLGVNYYYTDTVRPGVAGNLHQGASGWGQTSPWPGSEDVEFLRPLGPTTDMGWNQDPAGLTELLTTLAARFPGLPLEVTENGAAFPDTVDADGYVHDPQRIAYLRAHLHAVLDAIEAGAPVHGYFAWSLLDNFEWALGYDKRFGLTRVDPVTQDRYIKASGQWYGALGHTRQLEPLQPGDPASIPGVGPRLD
ncbi:GH1 family beta-glucosidase [Buchananella hordeovulneris]|uniref:GH1 family beta-glucosidase n=1 Tax=Buchananella hordeovulneris TaxID=52770 RepID=UPI001C9E8FEA|nr:GH1 family beta-glucosidase [Buchananella hordeovulneris]